MEYRGWSFLKFIGFAESGSYSYVVICFMTGHNDTLWHPGKLHPGAPGMFSAWIWSNLSHSRPYEAQLQCHGSRRINAKVRFLEWLTSWFVSFGHVVLCHRPVRYINANLKMWFWSFNHRVQQGEDDFSSTSISFKSGDNTSGSRVGN